MARFIPNIRPDQVTHDSERLVFEALAGLPASFVVLHSFPWLRARRDLANEPLSEGEADFIILHPQRGLLVLEVKGGVPELRDRTWYRGGEEMRDPFDQARRNRFALLEAIEERTRRRLNRGMFTHGDAVVFPHCTYDGALPLNTDARILVDSRGLHELPARIEAAFVAWERQATNLSPILFSELQQALLPKLRLMRCVGAELAVEGTRIIQVTGDQRATMQGLLASDRVLVQGSAGSGKTLLALDFIVSLVESGKSVLFFCFNRHLAVWVREQMAAEPRIRGRENALEIGTFHSFALSIARRARIEFVVPADDEEQFWDDEVPMILEQALDVLRATGQAPVFDAVVIDEAQDFSRDWWVTVESLTRNGREGRLYVFLDLNQSLRGEAQLPSVPLPARFNLRTNCRNTRAIARSAGRLASIETILLPGIPEGELPAVRRPATAVAGAGLVLQEIRTLVQSQVTVRQLALIGPASYENGSLSRFREVDGIPFVTDAAAWRRGEGILVTTARAFKGLEADVVLLYDVSGFGESFRKTDLYVAWTRAKLRLLVFCHGVEVRAAVEEALALAARS